MEYEDSDEEESCENCEEIYPTSSLLKHIGKNKECKAFYGPRFHEMKKQQATDRKARWRQNMSKKDKKKLLKNQRQQYAKDTEKKEKLKQAYKEKKEKKLKELKQAYDEKKEKKLKETQQPGTSNEQRTKSGDEKSDDEEVNNILYRSSENFREILLQGDALCHSCKSSFTTNSILKHIGNSKDCKKFYGPKFEDIKREQKKIVKEVHMMERGKAKEREEYASNPEIRKRKKDSYLKKKEKKKILKEEEHKKYNSESASSMIGLRAKSCRKTNLKGKKRLSWIPTTFQHFFENFNESKERIKTNILDIEERFFERWLTDWPMLSLPFMC